MPQSRRTARGASTGALMTSAAVFVLSPLSAAVHAEQEQTQRRQIEEVVVTAEKRQASVQDTSISISAFEGEFLADFGIRNQEDLQNFIPATTIQPYDMAVRGIGRSFRALGGDPGIATYFDGVYSEDFGIASSEGGLWDIERIEVLRGPQGTLYGRNAVGGAINFISNKPTDEFEGSVKTNVGTYGLFEVYGMLSGPVIDGLLNARATGIKRERDGYYDDITPGNQDVGNYGDENYTLTLEFTPFDNFSWTVRGNERSYRRRMGAAGQTAGILTLSEAGGQNRDTVTETFGFREILSSATDPLATSFDLSQGADALAAASMNVNSDPAQALSRSFVTTSGSAFDPALQQLFRFANPYTGETVIAQRLRPGIDRALDDEPSRNFGCAGAGCQIAPRVDADDLDGNDLNTATNGFQDEFFDHQASYSTMEWDATDALTVKYVFGYTDYFYDRTSDRDLTSNPSADETFYVSQENENFQHEVQFLFDFGERATLTSGLYFYDTRITQRGDTYSAVGESRYADAATYGDPTTLAVLDAALEGNRVSLFTSRQAAKAGTLTPAQQFRRDRGDTINTAGIWLGDNENQPGGCTSIESGPKTCGSFVEYQAQNNTEAFAFYNQAEIFLNDEFSLTLGLRYAEDERTGEENVFLYTEATGEEANLARDPGLFGLNEVLALAALDRGDGNNLLLAPDVVPIGGPVVLPTIPTFTTAQYNIATGAIDPLTLQQTGTGSDVTRYRGIPFGVSFFRETKETFDAWTYRVNLDWEPNETTLIYAGVTTGFRAGGFNLGNLQENVVYDQEEITAYEIGWKDQLFDRSVQVNASVYYYDYEDVHQIFSGFSTALGAVVDNVTNVPSAEVMGFEGDVYWLTTERLTLGGNFSFTNAEYTSNIIGEVDTDGDNVLDTTQSLVVDNFNAEVPGSLFPGVTERTVSIKGNQMLLIPEIKWTVYGIYDIPLGNRGNVQLRSTLSYTDEVFFSIENNPVDRAPEYFRWDARVSWTSADEAFVISGFVNNIMNEIGVRQIARYEENQNFLRTATPTDPRLMGMEFTYRFGAF